MTKDVIECILERRCVRKFKKDSIPQAAVGRLVDAARWAPSAGNLQPWGIYVVYNAQKKEELAAAAFGQQFVAEAPVVLAICAYPEVAAARYRERGRNLYAIQDTAAMVQNILLAANGYGLGTCWVGAFDDALVVDALNCPQGCHPVALIPVGYPADEPAPPARKAAEDIVEIIE
ncbi:nitroreductase family protein [bacterium]|nr:MAG: nitroreductase family protein [bacterium]